MDSLGTAIVGAAAGGIIGGVAGFFVARFQRTWDLDARKQEDRRARIRAAIDVILRFMDGAEKAERFGGMWPMRQPFDALTNADRFAISSVLRLFPGTVTWESFWYAPNFLDGAGQVGLANVSGESWKAIRAYAGGRLAVLNKELEELGDPDLRNFD
ncbi:MAG TPA: hypothetical protein VKR24_03310 [Candidatus Limnocylindrales bacterium]|nr:hypothetical protein [Candidatus Limnocylindrales bacterium]